MLERNKVGSNKYKSIKKSENEKVKILAKLKSQNLPKSRFKN